nr:MAG TPA: hypothetical protein [Caudoviricetes sp.]
MFRRPFTIKVKGRKIRNKKGRKRGLCLQTQRRDK